MKYEGIPARSPSPWMLVKVSEMNIRRHDTTLHNQFWVMSFELGVLS